MLTKIETQARKKAKLTPYMDVLDFQIILLSGLVLPMAIWLLTGLGWVYTIWIVVIYMGWILMFKINKPSGYGLHFWKFKIRGKAWTAYGGAEPEAAHKALRER
jgi:hypothetical protein